MEETAGCSCRAGPGRHKGRFLLLVASLDSWVRSLTAVTLAPGTTAPLESCTVPWSRAVWVWAKPTAARRANIASSTKTRARDESKP